MPPQLNDSADGWTLALFGGGAVLSSRRRTVVPRNRKSQAILGYVALNPNRRATREQVAGLLWSESPEPQARASLRQALRGLRQVLSEERIAGVVVDREDTSIVSSEINVDVWTLLSRIKAGELDPLLLETKNISETLLANLDDLDPAFRTRLLVQRESLHERLVFELETRLAELDPEMEAGRHENRLGKAVALALLNLDPTHEGACRPLIRASA